MAVYSAAGSSGTSKTSMIAQRVLSDLIGCLVYTRTFTIVGRIKTRERMSDPVLCYDEFNTLLVDHALMFYFKSHLDTFDSVYVPRRGNREPLWVGFGECVWDGPITMSLKYPLRPLYSSILAKDQQNRLHTLIQLFGRCGVENASWKELVSELEELRDNEIEDLDAVVAIYDYMQSYVWNEPKKSIGVR